MRRTLVFAIIAYAHCASRAAAGITYTSTARTLHAERTEGSSLNAANPSLGEWTHGLFAWDGLSGPSLDPNSARPLNDGAAWAVQNSHFDADVIRAQLVAKAWDGLSNLGGNAMASVNATFVLQAPTNCIVAGSWSTTNPGVSSGVTPASTFQFSGPAGPLVNSAYSSLTPSIRAGSFMYSGMLMPGTYVLASLVQEDSHVPGSVLAPQSMTLDFTISIPAAPIAGSMLACASVLCIRRRQR